MSIDTTWTDPSTGGSIDLNTGDILTAVVWDKVLSNLKHVGSTDGSGIVRSVCNGRLTLTSGSPVTTADVTAATSVYFTPYLGNKIAIYDGVSLWKVYTFTELSVSLASATASKPHDIFIYDNAGTLTLEKVEWTSDTARATALAVQDGRYVKTGSTNKLYLGTIRTTSVTGQTEDSTKCRFVWNMYNRIERKFIASDTTSSWTYTTATIRARNNNTTDGVGRFSLVVGVQEGILNVEAKGIAKNSSAGISAELGIGVDVTNAWSQDLETSAASYTTTDSFGLHASLRYIATVGYHFIQALEYSQATGTCTWYGTAGNGHYGLVGTMLM